MSITSEDCDERLESGRRKLKSSRAGRQPRRWRLQAATDCCRRQVSTTTTVRVNAWEGPRSVVKSGRAPLELAPRKLDQSVYANLGELLEQGHKLRSNWAQVHLAGWALAGRALSHAQLASCSCRKSLNCHLHKANWASEPQSMLLCLTTNHGAPLAGSRPRASSIECGQPIWN